MAPSISPEDLLLGLASAVLLLWAMVYVACSGFDRSFARSSVDDAREGLFAKLPLRHRSTQLALVLSLFAHLFWASSLPWVEKFLPGEIPMNWKKYDLVVVQFKPTDATLVLPPPRTSRDGPGPGSIRIETIETRRGGQAVLEPF